VSLNIKQGNSYVFYVKGRKEEIEEKRAHENEKRMSDNEVKKETRYPVLHQVFIRRNVISRGVIHSGVSSR
jgi:hypothetical protein